MKIAFTIGSLAGGGAERVVARLSNEFCREGQQVRVFMIANSRVEYPVEESLEISAIQPKINICGLRYCLRLLEYRKQVLTYAPDVVISFTTAVNLFVLQALKGTGIRVILSERNNPYTDPSVPNIRKKRDRIYSRANGFVFQTPDARDYFEEKIRLKSTVILNPLDNTLPNPWTGEREKRIVSVGRLEKQKNQELLLNAFSAIAKQFPEYTLEIYGEGSLLSALEKQITELGLEKRVFLKGYTPHVLELIRQAALFVLPSDYEGLSNALIEAMAIGLPVISTDHPAGGARMLIEPGVNGLLVSVGDEKAMASAMEGIISNPTAAEEMSKKATALRERLSVREIAAQWMLFIQRVENSTYGMD